MAWQEQVEDLAGTNATLSQIVSDATEDVAESGLTEAAGERFWREVHAKVEDELEITP